VKTAISGNHLQNQELPRFRAGQARYGFVTFLRERQTRGFIPFRAGTGPEAARIAGLVAVGLHTQPGAPERDAGVAQIAAGAPDPARVPEFAARFFATLDKWRPKT